MADLLLECLIQIKGVADTPRRLGLRLAGASGADTVRGLRMARLMAEAEECYARCLALMLAEDRPAVPELPRDVTPIDAPAEMPEAGWLERFATRRSETVAVLERCSVEQLCRTGIEASRGPMTVSDLVAVMLAHDTDCLGEITPRA